MKICPYCQSQIPDSAVQCSYCMEQLNPVPIARDEQKAEQLRRLRNDDLPITLDTVIEKAILSVAVGCRTHRHFSGYRKEL